MTTDPAVFVFIIYVLLSPYQTEFVSDRVFSSQEELELELFDYVNWFNTIRIYGALDYLTPKEYKRTFQAEMSN